MISFQVFVQAPESMCSNTSLMLVSKSHQTFEKHNNQAEMESAYPFYPHNACVAQVSTFGLQNVQCQIGHDMVQLVQSICICHLMNISHSSPFRMRNIGSSWHPKSPHIAIGGILSQPRNMAHRETFKEIVHLSQDANQQYYNITRN